MCCSANKPVLVPPNFSRGGTTLDPWTRRKSSSWFFKLIQRSVEPQATNISRTQTALYHGQLLRHTSLLRKPYDENAWLSLPPPAVRVRMYYSVPDPDFEIRGEGRGGSSRHWEKGKAQSPKYSSAHRASGCLKINGEGGGGTRVPPLDPLFIFLDHITWQTLHKKTYHHPFAWNPFSW